MRRLILIHGRSQQNKAPEELKKQWMEALHEGLRKAGRDVTIPGDKISFPYFGDTLFPLSEDPNAPAPELIVRGAETDSLEQVFVTDFLRDVVKQLDISDAYIRGAADDPSVIHRDVQNWPWVLAVLRVLDRMPGLGAVSLALVTRDVYQYLDKGGIQRIIENGVAQAFRPDEETVVVGHSLGSVIAYKLLVEEGRKSGWRVPTLITVGSPLAVRTVATKLSPVAWPDCVGSWFNAYDPRDTVSLFPLMPDRFKVTSIENATVENRTPNRHGITGYLGHRAVAERIHDALIA
ncbi:hypothetical protein [Streptomyces sp. enrichment culture]|uniref:hypothetical protein n=1 Tax=Streptomyces sp. enrichment culture TaxID=1795815 RepID=UPI003F545B33